MEGSDTESRVSTWSSTLSDNDTNGQANTDIDVRIAVEMSSSSSGRLSRGERFVEQFADLFDGYGYGMSLLWHVYPESMRGRGGRGGSVGSGGGVCV